MLATSDFVLGILSIEHDETNRKIICLTLVDDRISPKEIQDWLTDALGQYHWIANIRINQEIFYSDRMQAFAEIKRLEGIKEKSVFGISSYGVDTKIQKIRAALANDSKKELNEALEYHRILPITFGYSAQASTNFNRETMTEEVPGSVLSLTSTPNN